MHDNIEDLALDGIRRFEVELMIRDFIDVLPTGDPNAMLPFLHHNMELAWGRHHPVIGARKVLRLLEDLSCRLGSPHVDISAIAGDGPTVLVEHSMYFGAATPSDRDTLHCFSAFRTQDLQIVQWHQVSE